ncbi:MAG: dihydroneopterin aldolase [Candidatus Bipolaricaulia bacterium]
MDDRAEKVRLIVEGIQLEGPHGVYAEEREQGNRFRIDIEVVADLSTAVSSDRLEDTVDYGSVVHFIEEINRQRQFNLIESFAGAISNELLTRFSRIDEVLVRVRKVSPHGLGNVECAAAEVRRSRG